MSAEMLNLFPTDYPTVYVGVTDEWWTESEYAPVNTKRFSNFVMNEVFDKCAFVFASKKLGKGDGYAVVAIHVGVSGDDAYIRGIQLIGTYKSSPDRRTQNEGYIAMMSDAILDKYQYGRRYYLGEGDSMKAVKDTISAWMMGEITPSGSIPDYDFVEGF